MGDRWTVLALPLAALAGACSPDEPAPPPPAVPPSVPVVEKAAPPVAAAAEVPPAATPSPYTNEALRAALLKGRDAPDFRGGVEEDALLEIVRRGGEAWEKALREEVRFALESGKDPEERVPDLNLLACLRRIQGKRDPLEVAIDGLDGVECTWPYLPECTATMRNVDEEGLAFRYKIGGDYRTGRHGRFRFDVRDEKGTPVPVQQRWGSMGGMYSRGPMKPAGTWEARLRMSDYLSLPGPGTYTVRVQYHDQYEIAGSDDVRGCLVFTSREFRVVSKGRRIDLTRADWDRIATQVAALDESKDLVISPPGGDGSGSFAPESPPALILAEGWKSVPVLIDALQTKGTTLRKRAWLLGLLFSLTGQHDPTDGYAVVDEYRSGRPGVSSSTNGEPSGGMSGVSSSRARGTPIDLNAQMEFAARWTAFLSKLEVRVGD